MSIEICASSIETSTCCPRPVRSRSASTASTPMAPNRPPPRSPMGMPLRIGPVSGVPVMDMPPPMPWTTWSNAGRCVCGPVCPKPVTEQVMMRGLTRASDA
ncbi:hypothetical protein BBB43_14180 [Bordetella parapertussis]|nr:hypothetical protein BBB43_14180 [Bordetella parapertussis]